MANVDPTVVAKINSILEDIKLENERRWQEFLDSCTNDTERTIARMLKERMERQWAEEAAIQEQIIMYGTGGINNG